MKIYDKKLKKRRKFQWTQDNGKKKKKVRDVTLLKGQN